jgi:prophage regulatory protein
MRPLVTFKQLRLVYGIPFSPQHVGRLQRAGKFPLRRKIGKLNFWLADEIEAWIAALPIQRPRPSEEG